MAIIKGIDEGDYILKYKEIERRYQMNHATGMYEYMNVEQYFILKLTTRRARTNGATITGGWAKVFMDALKIKTIPSYQTENGEPRWVAVGTQTIRFPKQQWDDLAISEVADTQYQKKIRNENLSLHILLDRHVIKEEDVQKYKEITDDDVDSDVWVPEPALETIPMYDLETGHRTYRNWGAGA